MAAAIALTAVLATATAAPAPAARADGCYTWSRTLREDMSGPDVWHLRLRVAGYPGYGKTHPPGRDYTAATTAAVRRFQNAYGLTVDGIAGPEVFAALYELQDDDCTPVSFSYADMDDGCHGGYAGGAVSAKRARRNALGVMWQLEALRHALGDRDFTIVSGFRSYECNANVGVSNSRHLYGDAADLVSDEVSLCAMARAARRRGFTGIYGPGYPNHDDHTHLNRGTSQSWSAELCNVD